MGIQGLLPLLKSIHKPTHLRNFAGQTLGVDAYGWLHRGTVSCAIELAQQKPTRKHIEFTLNRVRMLIHFGVKPFLVFDGDYLPSKAHTEKERAARRKESKRAGLELLRMEKISQAHLELQKAVDVTPLMARELIEELKLLDVPYIVAPYEADSQLAYLERQGVIDGVISEDSDLLVFGTKCLLTKLDQHGECIMINRVHFTACREISLVGWTDKEFRLMAMLSGCDYLPGIGNMRLKTAYRLVRKHKVVDRLVRTVQFDGKMKVPPGYLEAFAKAEHTFLYQWVYCPQARRLVNLNPIPADLDVDAMPYIGKDVEQQLAAGVATGDLDPNTKERIILPPASRYPASRSRLAQTPDEKQGKPISEFFKACRTPLAELDPNAFTPSPSQHRLLEAQQNTVWSASQAPLMQPPALSSVASVTTPTSAPRSGCGVASTPNPTVSRASPKRQRLCSDSSLAASMGGSVGLETATSRFFSKRVGQPSPSLRKTSVQRKREDFELWSDEVAAEAVAVTLAETKVQHALEAREAKATTSPRKRKKLAIYTDPDAATPVDQSTTETSQETSPTMVSVPAQSAASTKTPATSLSTTTAQAERSLFIKGVDANFADLKSQWAFQPGTPRQSIARSKSTPTSFFTPSQGAERNTLLDRSAKVPASPEHPSEDEVLVPASSPPLCAAADPVGNEDGIEDEEWLAMERREVSPVAFVLEAKGSEDLLVPNSPSSEEDSDGRLRPRLDLGRFAFGA
ncbi:Rad2 nuclease [Friedmanniomyces endolithicus]|nr:Rad2 nuclease [Friedmanniomyces endolithicus]KAK0783375.1 Rad2 nuclease [Friedmanniomyces endolithicus]KAK0787029.1 Rad2 nuclease [Friedmanniomyces endolithicus]KAK0801254.1 Rad2 nuclease [Friedmanniomyces endolithicus]KAK0841794.1 Rad2 nuclease [Friedmanniomyces endolithicus]